MHVSAGHLSFVLSLLQLVVETSSAQGSEQSGSRTLSLEKSIVWGPGLKTRFSLPVRYFFVHAVGQFGENFTHSLGEKAFEVKVTQEDGSRARIYAQVLDLQDGSYVVRFRPFETYSSLRINLLHDQNHVAKSPYYLKGMVYHEDCYCPMSNIEKWYTTHECPDTYEQIDRDLSIFKKKLNLKKVASEAISRFNQKGMHSLTHYRIINNKVYRKTYGEHVGFKMFSDAIILSLTRKVVLPDIEFFVNLGDWPLEKKSLAEDPIPVFSWCGSDDSKDIVMPTYDLTEATLQMMSRVTLDTLSVQATKVAWENKTEKAFWRGRDSRQERLDLVVMSRKEPQLVDAALTHMFFFKKEPEKYGELVKSTPFFDFFDYKYQINLDGTVAAYRFPYLMGGNSVVLKQDSPYYEHFYKSLEPNKHYIPFKRDLSNLREKILWAKSHDEEAKKISRNAQQFVKENLLPKDVFCYHVKLFDKFSERLLSRPEKPDDSWDLVEQPSDESKCDCKRLKKMKKHDEL
ncbi:protein O-glucosyltransferase 2-like [Ostrea edulis]|uniref:protein O-glucosyltransferase 2-like n=1 Tax=Ostrea edulis TaxID=37623 RepID=UPI0024AF4FBE|nr:protein O-glucosyltransferase 2-like [Ostrea edulis]